MSYGNFGEHHNWLVVSNASYVSIVYGIILPIDFHMFQHSYNGGLEHLDYFSRVYGNVINPTDELKFFRGVL